MPALAMAMLGLTAVHTFGQTREVLAEAPVRDLARQAAREAKGEPTELVLALDRRVRERWGDFESFPLTIVQTDDLLVALSAPYMAFRNSLIDMLRSGRSIDRAVWANLVTVAITPRRLDAQDIESVAVTRNNQEIEPIRNALRRMRFSNGTGEDRMIHAGDISFPPAAFSPGGTVVLTLKPRGTDPIVRSFTDDELRRLR